MANKSIQTPSANPPKKAKISKKKPNPKADVNVQKGTAS